MSLSFKSAACTWPWRQMLKLPSINHISIDAHFVPYTKELLRVTCSAKEFSHNENSSLDEEDV